MTVWLRRMTLTTTKTASPPFCLVSVSQIVYPVFCVERGLSVACRLHRDAAGNGCDVLSCLVTRAHDFKCFMLLVCAVSISFI